MPEPISYICERSAEYVLIPELVRKFRERYSFVTPIYPWMTREGSRFSREQNAGAEFRVLGVYARRPKFLKLNDNLIHVKINQEIVVSAAVGRSLGIPMIAGCPLARNIKELGSCSDYIWVDLKNIPSSEGDFTILVDGISQYEGCYSDYVIGDLEDVLEAVELEARCLDFNTLIDSIKNISTAGKGGGVYHPFAYMGGYKAVYLLMADI